MILAALPKKTQAALGVSSLSMNPGQSPWL